MAQVTKTAKNDFSKGEIWRVILRMAIPMILAQLVNVLYSVVDRMYIGHIPGIGSLALTGIGLCMPIISIISAFANMCGMGGGPLCSIARGEKNIEKAERIMGNSLTLLLIFGTVLTGVLLCFMEEILYLFGASDVTYPYAAEYARVYILGTYFVMISLGMNPFINCQGFATMGMITVLVGAVVNIILDPIFIFVFDMGVAGAAWATIIAQCCSAIWVLVFLKSKKAILDLNFRSMKPDGKIMGKICALGTTGFVMSATNGAVQIASNTQLQLYGGELYVGAMTVINSVREVVFMVAHGLTSATQPVLGYNYGAKAYKRVKQGINFMIIASFAYCTAVWIPLMLLPKYFILIFNNDPELVKIAIPGLRIYFCCHCIMSMQLCAQSTFVGLGKSKPAIFFSLLRKVVIVVPLTFLLPMIDSIGAYGVFWAEPISDVIGGAVSFAAMYFMVYRKLDGQEAALRAEKVEK